jgi:hypothetical protein
LFFTRRRAVVSVGLNMPRGVACRVTQTSSRPSSGSFYVYNRSSGALRRVVTGHYSWPLACPRTRLEHRDKPVVVSAPTSSKAGAITDNQEHPDAVRLRKYSSLGGLPWGSAPGSARRCLLNPPVPYLGTFPESASKVRPLCNGKASMHATHVGLV